MSGYLFFYIAFFINAMLVTSYLSLKKKITAVHYNNLPNFPIFAAILPKLLNAKIILDNHDLISVIFSSKFEGKKGATLFNWLLKFEQKISMRFADIVIAADHNQREALVAAGIKHRKTVVILNTANENFFHPVHKRRTDCEFRIVYHGTITERLGLDIAIQAVHKTVKEIPGLRFYLIGAGDFLKRCKTIVEHLSMQDVVRISGCFYPVEELSEILCNMDVGVVPNRKTPATENYMLPVKLLEYVYLNIPVIAPRFNIIQRYFNESMVSFFEPDDPNDLARCIVELYRNPKKRLVQTEKAYSFVLKYNWRSQSQIYLDIIKSSHC
jgi:glycosyltransferase involved in cell wall biosynthesis